MSRRAVIVTGFPEQANLEQLREYFVSKGAEVESGCLIRLDHDDRVCVRFTRTEVCQGVLFHGNHVCSVNDQQVALEVSACPADAEDACLPHCDSQQKAAFVFGAKSLSPTGIIPSQGGICRSTSTPNLVPSPPCKVLVQGISKKTSKDILTLLFESENHSGGGDVKDIDYNPETGTAVVEFDKPEVAERVTRRRSVQFHGSTMRLSSLDESYETEAPSATVRISGFGLDTGDELLSMYLENSKRSGGGEIKDIHVDHSSSTAHVTFKESTVAERVSRRRDLQLGGRSLQVQLCQSDRDSSFLLRSPPVTMQHRRSGSADVSANLRRRSESGMGESCAVLVEVPPDDVTVNEEYLRSYFQNHFRSGGGEVKHIYRDPVTGYYTVTFMQHDVTSHVLTRSHKIGANTIVVTSLPSRASDMPLVSGQPDPKKVYVHGITPGVSTLALTDHLKGGTNCRVEDWTYNIDATTCLVEFGKPIDYMKLVRHLRQFPLCGVMLGLERVSRSCQLQVDNIDHATDQTLELYFESPSRSGCGGDIQVTFARDQGYAIVTCSSPEVAAQTCSRSHTLSGHRLQVALYYPGLGVLPPDVDSKSPFRPPASLLVSGIDPTILGFVKQSKEANTELDKLMAEAGAKLEWTHESDCEVKVCCVLSPSDAAARTLTWQNRVETIVVEFMGQFQCEAIRLSPEITAKKKKVPTATLR